MDTNTFLSILLYVSGFVLIIVFIIVGLKIIKVLDRVDRIADNIEDKVNSVNGAVDKISKAADGIANISNSVVFGISSAVSKIFNKKIKKEEE